METKVLKNGVEKQLSEAQRVAQNLHKLLISLEYALKEICKSLKIMHFCVEKDGDVVAIMYDDNDDEWYLVIERKSKNEWGETEWAYLPYHYSDIGYGRKMTRSELRRTARALPFLVEKLFEKIAKDCKEEEGIVESLEELLKMIGNILDDAANAA